MGIRVSEVDHISEGVHNAINRMYQAMDEYIREHGSPEQKAALTAALMAVNMPKCGSPADTRADWPGIPPAGDIDGTLNCVGPDKFKLANNVQCFYSGHPEIADNTLKLCEFAILNKTNTHETRVHHVETPNGILGGSVDVGPVWTSELKYAQSHGSSVDGMQGNVPAGVPTPPDSDPVVNNPAVYSIAVLTNAKKPGKARQFIDFVRSSMGQDIYENQGGFIRLDPSEMDGGRCYDSKGVETIRDGRCP